MINNIPRFWFPFIIVIVIIVNSCDKDAGKSTLSVKKPKETEQKSPVKTEKIISDNPIIDEVKIFGDTPILNNGKKWNIAYYEGGPYINYKNSLTSLLTALNEKGWFKKLGYKVNNDSEDLTEIWDWLSENKSPYLSFSQDHFYSSDWSKETQQKNKGKIMKELQNGEIDFVIAAGTAAGKDLANNDHKVPVMVVSTSNAVESGIIKSYEDSGYDHVTARVSPNRWERQIKLFHNIIGFKKLGVAYENTDIGRTYASLTDIEKTATELDFEIVSCFTISDVPKEEQAKAYQSVLKCHNELVDNIDAMFLTQQSGLDVSKFETLLAPFFKKNIPTISQTGTAHVKKGVLMGISRADYSEVGAYYAQTMAEILNGKKARDAEQIFEETPKITMNLEVAKRIGFDPPVDILSASDEIYKTIE